MPDSMHNESPLVQIDFSLFDSALDIALKEMPFLGHINLRGRPDNLQFMQAVSNVLGVELPLEANTFVSNDAKRIYWLGPDEWLIVTPENDQTSLESNLRRALQGCFCSITDVSGGQTLLQVTGNNARALLQKGCSLDLHPRTFKTGDCAQTRLAKAAVLLSQVSDEPVFEIIVRRSFADYLGLWLQDAVQEFTH